MLEHLRGLREDKDLSQTEMAKILNIHQTTYSHYELEETNVPNKTLLALATYFQTSVDYILDFTDEITPYPRKKPQKYTRAH